MWSNDGWVSISASGLDGKRQTGRRLIFEVGNCRQGPIFTFLANARGDQLAGKALAPNRAKRFKGSWSRSGVASYGGANSRWCAVADGNPTVVWCLINAELEIVGVSVRVW